MKWILIICLLPITATAQLSTNQKKQVTTMIATAINKLTTTVDSTIKSLQTTVTATSKNVAGISIQLVDTRDKINQIDSIDIMTIRKNQLYYNGIIDSLKLEIAYLRNYKTSVRTPLQILPGKNGAMDTLQLKLLYIKKYPE